MKCFDSHCHLDDRYFKDDADSAIRRAKEAGVCEMMIVGTDLDSSRKVVEMARKGEGLYASVGVHPHDAVRCGPGVIDSLRELAQNPRVRAWGETGLDFNRMYSPARDQEKCFARQMEAAGDLGLPLIFHERDSKGRFLEMLKSRLGPKMSGVVHCFSGSRLELEQYLALGLHIGVTGIVTLLKRGEKLRALVPLIPKDRILIETDAPYLTPAPQKNKTRRNEPAFVVSVLRKLADALNEDPAELARALRKNTLDFFNIHP